MQEAPIYYFSSWRSRVDVKVHTRWHEADFKQYYDYNVIFLCQTQNVTVCTCFVLGFLFAVPVFVKLYMYILSDPKDSFHLCWYFIFPYFFCAACQMYCILKDVKVYFNFWKQIKYHDVRKTFSLRVVYYNVISSVPPCWWSFYWDAGENVCKVQLCKTAEKFKLYISLASILRCFSCHHDVLLLWLGLLTRNTRWGWGEHQVWIIIPVLDATNTAGNDPAVSLIKSRSPSC